MIEIQQRIDDMLDAEMYARHPKNLMQLAQEALKLSEESDYEAGIAKSLLALGIGHVNAEDFKVSLDYFHKALPYFVSEKNDYLEIMTYCYLMFAYFQLGDRNEEMKYGLLAYDRAKAMKHPRFCQIANGLGMLYMDIGKLEEGNTYLEQIVDFETSNVGIVCTALYNMVSNYLNLNMFEKAEECARKAIRIGQDAGNKEAEAFGLEAMGIFFAELKDFEAAVKYQKQALEIYMKLDSKYSIAIGLSNIGDTYLKAGRYAEACEYLMKAVVLAEELELNWMLKQIHAYLVTAYEKQDDYKQALEHYKLCEKYEKIAGMAELEQRLNKREMEIQLEAYKDIKVISEIGQELTAALDMDDLFGRIHQQVTTLMETDGFGIAFYDAGTGVIDYKMFIENGKRLPAFQGSIHNKKSQAAKCIREREMIVEQDVGITPEGNHTRTIVYCPLIIEGGIIGVLTVQSYKANAYNERQTRLIKTLSPYIAIALNNSRKSEELKHNAEELNETLINLKEAQNQLVHSEKMAALGQLVSGVAHEINTPFGAIQASANNVTMYVKSTLLEKLPQILKSMGTEEQALFFKMLKQSAAIEKTASSREERQCKRAVAEKLESLGIEGARGIADAIVKMGLQEQFEQYDALLKYKTSSDLFGISYEIADMQKNCQNIITAVERVSKIIYALKSYSHFDESSVAVKTKIEDSIETVLELYYHNIKHGVEVFRDYKLTTEVMGYPDELSQVWTNLISNALQAMEYKGRLEIETSEQDGNAVIRITDSGGGIPEEYKNRIFDAFFTTKKQGEGTGLGLEIVKRIIDKHSGTISVDSVPGRTTFTVKIPANREEA